MGSTIWYENDWTLPIKRSRGTTVTVKHAKEPRMGQPVEIGLENVRILSHLHLHPNLPPYSFSTPA